ncbi:arylsulfatase B [Pseudomonas fluorescens]|uniref:Arylsulfatase n=1 Tax=Pseudomonas fluorescens TaxID=294 RepID=A0A5E7V9D3_PSEFL|nr:arylsulfatase [Pseudomonas fluorescens]VVQ20632.1 Arylsulfatase [Pseudomonas fluorescens]
MQVNILIRMMGLGVGALASLLTASVAVAEQSKPNIVFFLADDLGNADLGYRGSDIQTPAIDSLARQGTRLESFYAQQVCTPARAALMTGRYPIRHGLQTLVIFPGHSYGLPLDERTLPQALKEAGYKTAIVGKWHLGHYKTGFWPNQRGFDHSYGNLMGEVDYFSKERGGVIDWQRDGQPVKEEGYHTLQLAAEAERLIEAHDPAQPLFLYMPFLAPHAPYQAPKEYEDRYPGIQDPTRRTYAGMITAVDDAVARVLTALEKKGMRENTLVVFASDNGGALSADMASGAGKTKVAHPPASNLPYRGGKGSLYEGAVRVPAIVNWPGHIPAGQMVNQPLHMIDWFPTLVHLAGGKVEGSKPLDGKDIWASLTEQAPSPHQELLLNAEAYRGALREGKWKLLHSALLPARSQLFDLEADPQEKHDLAAEHPEVVTRLLAKLNDYGRQQLPSKFLVSQGRYLKYQGKALFESEDNGAAEQADAQFMKALQGL